jgi:hypothetical protein
LLEDVFGGFELAELDGEADGEGGADVLGVVGGADDDGGGGAEDGSTLSPFTICWVVGTVSWGAPAR